MKLSAYIATSLDGYIARENGDLDWLPGSDGETDGEDYGFGSFLESVDTLVMGRNTYEMVMSFGIWPYGKKRVIVMSTRQISIPEELTDTVEARSCSPIELIDELTISDVKHIYVDGGKTIQGFIKADLLNEITITTVPVLIGSGIPLFGIVDSDVELRHLETQSFENGFVQSKYAFL